VWPSSAVPGTIDSGDSNPISVGVKISSSVPGTITGIRFYKSPANVGTHTGSLWSSTGQLLATGTFTNETASGWQELDFASPVPVKANTTYVASYDGGYFSNSSAGLAPLTALQSSTAAGGGNGLYSYGTGSTFPTTATAGDNYWVDAILNTATASTVPVPNTRACEVGSRNSTRLWVATPVP
jgi:hypothetical protein